MPVTHVYYKHSTFSKLPALRLLCLNMVPALFSTHDSNPAGRLTPGSIRFFSHPIGPSDYNSGDDVFLDMQAYYYPERADPVETAISPRQLPHQHLRQTLQLCPRPGQQGPDLSHRVLIAAAGVS